MGDEDAFGFYSLMGRDFYFFLRGSVGGGGGGVRPAL